MREEQTLIDLEGDEFDIVTTTGLVGDKGIVHINDVKRQQNVIMLLDAKSLAKLAEQISALRKALK